MKKYLIVLLLTCLVACQKSKTEIDETISENKISEVFSINSIDARKSAYLLLNSNEKLFIWRTHLTNLLKQDFSIEKRDIINQLLKLLNSQSFKSNLNNSKFTDSQSFLLLKYQIEKVFSSEEITNYFLNPTQYFGVNNQDVVELVGELRRCICHYGNDNGCGIAFRCAFECPSSSPGYSEDGCGWLWLESCNGTCPSDESIE